jgi:hypothetical protein
MEADALLQVGVDPEASHGIKRGANLVSCIMLKAHPKNRC